MIEHNKTRHERRIAVTLIVYEDVKGEPRFALDHFAPSGKGYRLNWQPDVPFDSAELDLFAKGVADSEHNVTSANEPNTSR